MANTSAEERIKNSVLLASEIFDKYTENTEEQKAVRNTARAFLQVLTEEEMDFEK